jgi:uncharacterized protein (DUF302 family)
MVTVSRHPFSRTIALLQSAISDSGSTIFVIIDQAAAAESVGLKLRPTTLIVFGNPKGGTPLMEAFPLVALELPLKLLIWEENGIVNVSYVPMSEIAARYGVKDMGNRIEAMDHASAALVNAVT